MKATCVKGTAGTALFGHVFGIDALRHGLFASLAFVHHFLPTSPDPVSSWQSAPAPLALTGGSRAAGVVMGQGLTDRDVRETRKPKRASTREGVFGTTRDYRRPVAEMRAEFDNSDRSPKRFVWSRSRMIPNLLNLQRLVGESPAERRCEGKKRQPSDH